MSSLSLYPDLGNADHRSQTIGSDRSPLLYLEVQNPNEYQALMTQRELCNRWQVSEATLERWCSEGIGPIYVKLGGQVAIGNLKLI